MPTVYAARNGDVLTKEQWKEKRADERYAIVRRYDNGAVRVDLEWVGKITDFGQVLPEYYKMFRLNVQNYDSGGVLRPDPVEQDRWFGMEERAIREYETFLMRWTESGIDRFGEFAEVGNTLALPNPDAPDAEPDAPELGGVGAW